MRGLCALLLVLLVTGCAPWVKTDGPVSSDTLGCTVDPPRGWMRQNTSAPILITRDGLVLQIVSINRVPLTREQHFKHTKRRVSAGMLPQEVAEVVIDEYQSDADYPFEAVEENAPETISGKPGCRLRLAFSNKDGLRFRCEFYALLVGDNLYYISYTAPARHYFDKDLPAVKAMVQSFRLSRF